MTQGYIYTVYGDVKYLKHAVASVTSLRRYDTERAVALVCEQHHIDFLKENQMDHLFTDYILIDPNHRSIVGFKHNLHHYMIYDENLYLDTDIIWCKNPDNLWLSFAPYDFTITGNQKADSFFGGPKNYKVVLDILLKRRLKTLRHFNLSYLPRVQSGVMYAKDKKATQDICLKAQEYLSRIDETHFVSRLKEKGRKEESCEWSLAMAMATFDKPVYVWLQGHTSAQLDFIDFLTDYDPDFFEVYCKYFSDAQVYSFRGIKTIWMMKLLIWLFSHLPGKGDYMKVTPYCLHFGWYHQKEPLNRFSDKLWNSFVSKTHSKKQTV